MLILRLDRAKSVGETHTAPDCALVFLHVSVIVFAVDSVLNKAASCRDNLVLSHAMEVLYSAVHSCVVLQRQGCNDIRNTYKDPTTNVPVNV